MMEGMDGVEVRDTHCKSSEDRSGEMFTTNNHKDLLLRTAFGCYRNVRFMLRDEEPSSSLV